MKNRIEIGYKENGNISISLPKPEDVMDVFNLLLDALGDIDITICNEINSIGNPNDMLIDSDRSIYFLTLENTNDLKNIGKTELVKRGTLKNFINLSNEKHIEFLKWYYNYDNYEEAVNAMRTELFN